MERVLTDENFDERDELYADFYKCPNCEDAYLIPRFNYCPNCGEKLVWRLSKHR